MRKGPIGCVGIILIAAVFAFFFVHCRSLQWYEIAVAPEHWKWFAGVMLGLLLGLTTPFGWIACMDSSWEDRKNRR